MTAPLLEVNDLKKYFDVGSGLLRINRARVYAVDGVSFIIDRGETLALVGESGCGKSTVGRCILRLVDVTGGAVNLAGRRIQVVFQDPFSSLNPRMRVKQLLAEPMRNFGLARSAHEISARIDTLLEQVRLPRDAAHRWPHEFSGGASASRLRARLRPSPI